MGEEKETWANLAGAPKARPSRVFSLSLFALSVWYSPPRDLWNRLQLPGNGSLESTSPYLPFLAKPI